VSTLNRINLWLLAGLAAAAPVAADVLTGATALPQFQVFPDPSGQFATLNVPGPIDTTNPFFQSLGTNGRSCVTCHQPADAWTVTPPHIRERFEKTGGRDPIFRSNDGANCPSADVSTTAARRTAYSLLLNKGLIRVELPVPAGAEFEVLTVDNPYGCADTAAVSVYRRPPPTASLADLSTVMWDGRETFKGQTITADLEHQALDATLGHAQAAEAPTAQQLQAIVDFELQLFTAQIRDKDAGRLDADGASGGPVALSRQEFFLGINDPLGLNPSGQAFTPTIFTLFDSWAGLRADGSDRSAARRAIVRGQTLFNTLSITITGVAGLNDVPLPSDGQVHPTIQGNCGTCHDSPNVGDHSLPAPLNIGLTDSARRTPDLPLITLRNRTTGATVQTTDPGRALVTGKWADIGKLKGPILRGLAARAPYFHNGSAATLGDALDFYNTRFALNLSARDKADLVAFLKTL
jgi:cytochrome c peroxidase